MFQQFERLLREKLLAHGVPNDVIRRLQFSEPPNSALGDIAFACFPLAKFWKMPPADAAHHAHEILLGVHEEIEDINESGPYLNFRIKTEWLVKKLQGLNESQNIQPQSDIMLEYCQPNTHKEFHIGHLRNACYGSSLVNIWRAVGRRVIAATYNNDVGSHVAKTLWAYKKFHSRQKPPKEKGRWLAGMYIEATRALEEHPEYKEEVGDVLRALESRDPKWTKLWKMTRQWSLNQFHQIYKELGLKFDASFDEHKVKDRGHKIVDELLRLGIAKESQGAIIMDFEEDHLGVLILRKSDGAGNYATSDLALAEEKFRRFKIDESVVVVDNRQSLYFKQLFATLRAYGFKQEMSHLPYELVTLPEGTMSSRKGNVILYEDLRDEVIAKAEETTLSRHADWSTAKIKKNACELAIGAIRFSMIKASPLKTIVFDKNEALSFEGFTAPYMQYTNARIESIFKKVRRVKQYQSGMYLWNHDEHALWFLLAQYSDTLKHATENNDPSEIAQYAFKLCRSFASYYELYTVLENDTAIQAARLHLVRSMQKTILIIFELLGIPPLKEM